MWRLGNFLWKGLPGASRFKRRRHGWGPIANRARAGHLAAVTLTLTLLLTAAAIAFTAFCGWRGSRPPDFRRGPRMAPYGLLMVFGAATTLLLIVHLVNLLGVSTGR